MKRRREGRARRGRGWIKSLPLGICSQLSLVSQARAEQNRRKQNICIHLLFRRSATKERINWTSFTKEGRNDGGEENARPIHAAWWMRSGVSSLFERHISTKVTKTNEQRSLSLPPSLHPSLVKQMHACWTDKEGERDMSWRGLEKSDAGSMKHGSAQKHGGPIRPQYHFQSRWHT